MNKSPSPTNEADSFDRLITKTQDKKINKSAKTIHYNTKSGNRKTINYKGNNKYEILIYKSIKEALYSEWFNEKKETTKCNNCDSDDVHRVTTIMFIASFPGYPVLDGPLQTKTNMKY